MLIIDLILQVIVFTFAGIGWVLVILNWSSNINRLKTLNKKNMLVYFHTTAGTIEEYAAKIGKSFVVTRKVGRKQKQDYTYALEKKYMEYKNRVPTIHVDEYDPTNLNPKEPEKNIDITKNSKGGKVVAPDVFSQLLDKARMQPLVEDKQEDNKLKMLLMYVLGTLVVSGLTFAKVYGFIR